MVRVNEDKTFEAVIEELDTKGEGLVQVESVSRKGKVYRSKLSIPYTLPGEKVKAQVAMPYRKNRAKLLEVQEAHPERIAPRCAHFGLCGGCSWQHWTYEAQLEQKTNQVKQYLIDNGHDPSLVRPTIPAVDSWHYRNKMEFTFRADGAIGLHVKGSYKDIIELEECHIATKLMIDVTKLVGDWVKEVGLPGYNKETNEGLFRNVIVRHSAATGEVMLALFATERPNETHQTELLVQRMNERFPEVKSLLWLVNRDIGDRTQAEETIVLSGRDFIYDELNNFRFRLWFDTFFQPNPRQAEVLVDLAIQMADPQPDERMVDLFCGVGTFSLPFAQHVKELYGVEIVETSIESAKRNAKDNGISNAKFFAQDARLGLRDVIDTYGIPDLLLVDPPRSGTGGKVMRRIARTEAARVVYVSCNPKTFAEDITHMLDFGYELEVVQPVDQFPQTYHIETVSVLRKTSPATRR